MDFGLDDKISGRLCDLVEEYRSALDRAEEEIDQLKQLLAEKDNLCASCSYENRDSIIEELEETLLTIDSELQKSQLEVNLLNEENLSLHRRLSSLEKNEVDSNNFIVKLQHQIDVLQNEKNVISEANKRNLELLDEYEEVIRQQELVTNNSSEARKFTTSARQINRNRKNNQDQNTRNNNYDDDNADQDNRGTKIINAYNINNNNNNNDKESSSDQSESESTLTRAAAISINTLSSPKRKNNHSSGRGHKLSPLRCSGKLPKHRALLQKLKGRRNSSVLPSNDTNIEL